ncbi:MAG TPA: agmatinase [Bacteroidales bacterium]|jgi:agmatinase|nr:agmatinase [Bacteroidales bacterium]HOS71475.1 agmatinase [Bacteroidales bacterium]HQH23927.1 agmatinase [Bacteroidales bacterium]HQJ81257.1 agmatinase [Bacteroidales bacterium]
MNFGGPEIVSAYAESEIVMVPVPYDETSTWIKGSDRGPGAIFEASPNLEFYDMETGTEVWRRGIFTASPVTEKRSPELLVKAVYERALSLLNEKKFPVIIGGNHTVSIGAARAFAGHYPDLTVLQLDAHADLRQEYDGSPYNHACVMARIRESVPVVQVGIRSMSAEELPYADRSRIFPAHELYADRELYGKALSLLSPDIYITIDLDVLDPSIMPSTGTPEPGGPGYRELMDFLREVAVKRNIVGFDVVELCPSPSNKAPDFVAAKIIYQLLSYIFALKDHSPANP